MKTPILIGSRALQFWHPNVQLKTDTDWDIISDVPLDIPNVEIHDPSILLNSELERYVREFIDVNGIRIGVVDLVGLAIVKRSHLFRKLSFDKHITQYHRHLKPATESFTGYDSWLLAKRTKETMKLFPQTTPSLKQSKEDFFDDYVTKKYDHDKIHELVAYEETPIYTKLLTEHGKVWCSEDSWKQLSFRQQCMAVAEETMVIAIERFLVPNDWKYSPKLAYFKSLEKVCTTLCSGWFRDFAIDNYPMIIDMFNKDRIMNIRSQLEGI
jgi:hypothetical protein